MALPVLAGSNISSSYIGVLHVNQAAAAALPASGTVVVNDGSGNASALAVGRANQGAVVTGAFTANGLTYPATAGGVTALIDLIYPVGAIFISVSTTNPGTYLTGTTWVATAAGKFIVGVGTGIDALGASFTTLSGNDLVTGEYRHTLITAELAAHTHGLATLGRGQADGNSTAVSQHVLFDTIGAAGATPNTADSTGSDQSHNNIPPYFGVYAWQRTA